MSEAERVRGLVQRLRDINHDYCAGEVEAALAAEPTREQEQRAEQAILAAHANGRRDALEEAAKVADPVDESLAAVIRGMK